MNEWKIELIIHSFTHYEGNELNLMITLFKYKRSLTFLSLI